MSLSQYHNIWVIGASTGIGRALVEALDDHHRTLFISARSEEKLAEVALSCEARCVSLPLDICDDAQLKAAAKRIDVESGMLDMVIVNAGTCEYIDGPDIDCDLVSRVMQTNFTGAVSAINHALPLLRKSKRNLGYAKLVIMSSSVTYQALPRAHAYGASKAALRYFSECLKIDLQREGIDVQLVSPGFVKTPLTDKNDFPMPFMMSPELAAQKIIKGLASEQFDIHFPFRFTWMLKVLSYLPNGMRYSVLQKMARPASSDSRYIEGRES